MSDVRKSGTCVSSYVYVQDSHSFCCKALAVASSAAVQFAARHSATAVWKAVLLQTQVVLVLNIRGEVREVDTSSGKNTHASVQVSVDVEFDKQPEMQLSTDWADTPTAITKRVAKTRRGLTIIACW
jgi:hypothetical protein